MITLTCSFDIFTHHLALNTWNFDGFIRHSHINSLVWDSLILTSIIKCMYNSLPAYCLPVKSLQKYNQHRGLLEFRNSTYVNLQQLNVLKPHDWTNTMEPPAASKLSPESTQHSESHHVTLYHSVTHRHTTLVMEMASLSRLGTLLQDYSKIWPLSCPSSCSSH